MSTAITWKGMGECRELFASLRAKSDDLTPILDFAGNTLTESTKERIADTKKDPDGNPWKGYVKPNYASIKKAGIKRKKPTLKDDDEWLLTPSPGGLLEHSGRLLLSINYNVLNSNEVAVGSSEDHARRHQDGGGGIPARPFLGISSQDSNVITKHIKQVLKGA